MNLASIAFTFLTYGLVVALYNGEGDFEETFPTFEEPEVEFREVPTDCSGFTDAIECVAVVLFNVAIGVVYFVLLIVEVITIMVQIFILIATSAVQGITGSPVWINAVVLGFFSISLSIIIYKAIRKGDTDSA